MVMAKWRHVAAGNQQRAACGISGVWHVAMKACGMWRGEMWRGMWHVAYVHVACGVIASWHVTSVWHVACGMWLWHQPEHVAYGVAACGVAACGVWHVACGNGGNKASTCGIWKCGQHVTACGMWHVACEACGISKMWHMWRLNIMACQRHGGVT
jgi:hypothetical protein